MNSENNMHKKIEILDWGIVFASIIMLFMVYMPISIWNEEAEIRSEARHRMLAISNAQEFYKELTGFYTMDGEHLFELVEAAMDSLLADSLFLGEQKIILRSGAYDVNMEEGFEGRGDTTFSEPENIRVTKLDTIYTVGLSNIDSGGIDTIFVNRSNLDYYKSQSNFYAIFNQDTSSRSELITDYLRMKYHLSNDLLYCPITNEKYIFEIDSTGNENLTFTVRTPLSKDYKERRFIIFSFESGDHGRVIDGNTSWAQ